MKKSLFVLALLLISASAQAQMQIRTTPVYGGGASDRAGFSIGPRYSNYSTDVDTGLFTIESGRQHAFGLVGELRSGVFVLDFNWDHDPENGLQITDLLPIDFGRYERDRGEFTVGWAALPVLDLQAGFRVDQFSIGSDFGGDFSGDDFDHSAIVVGVNVHTPTRRPFGVYGKGVHFSAASISAAPASGPRPIRRVSASRVAWRSRSATRSGTRLPASRSSDSMPSPEWPSTPTGFS